MKYRFYISNNFDQPIASLSMDTTPNIGDFIRIDGGLYRVGLRKWEPSTYTTEISGWDIIVDKIKTRIVPRKKK